MSSWRTLILTDHSGHSEHNSVYALARALATDPRSLITCIASRATAQNASFFGGDAAQVWGTDVGATFGYDPTGTHYHRNLRPLDPADFDLIWLRLPHPIPPGFASAMERLDAGGPAVVNHPRGMLETGSKAYLTRWAAFTPPLALVRTDRDILDFIAGGAAVLKPLRAHGGRGLVKVSDGVAEVDGTVLPLREWLARRESDPLLAVRYLPTVSKGDKRILVVNGRILGASLRLPAPGGWLCNVARGGRSLPATVSPEEVEMAAAISPELLRKGVVFYGMDTLEDASGKRVLSELNTLSIGGFPHAEAQSGNPVVQWAVDELLNYLEART